MYLLELTLIYNYLHKILTGDIQLTSYVFTVYIHTNKRNIEFRIYMRPKARSIRSFQLVELYVG